MITQYGISNTELLTHIDIPTSNAQPNIYMQNHAHENTDIHTV